MFHSCRSCHQAGVFAVPIMMLLTIHVGNAQAKKINGDRLFAPNHVVEVDISLPPSDWDELRAQTRNISAVFSGATTENPFTYFKADISIDGVRIESVGLRKKGFIGSLDNDRPSLKINFDKFVSIDPIKGLSQLTLNNNKQDKSQVSQLLTYKLFRDAGVHAPRTNFARVTVNGQYLGIYTNVESIKKPFLARSFGDKSGNLYEGTLTDFHPKTVEKLEAKTNEKENDRGKILRLAKLLATDGDLDIDEIEKLVDLDNFLRFWAIEGMVRFWDGYASNQNNFFFYMDPTKERGYFIPWGADSSFSKGGGPFARFSNQDGTILYAQSTLANRLYNSDGIPDRYRETMSELLRDVWNEAELIAEIDRAEKLIGPHLHASQKNAPAEMNQVREFIRSRRQEVQDELAKWPPNVPAVPRKPMYTVVVGEASGSFETVWSEQAPDNPTKTGKTDVAVEMGEMPVELAELGVHIQKFEMPSFGRGGGFGRGGPGGGTPANFKPPVNLVFTGTRSADQQRLTVSLFVDATAFAAAKGDAISVTGRLSEGESGGFGFGSSRGRGKIVSGELTLTDSGTKEGDMVRGRIELKFVEMHGGMFDRQAGRGGPPGGSPRGRGDAQATSGVSDSRDVFRAAFNVQRVIDANSDRKISAAEMEAAPDVLRSLDTDGDGEISRDEMMVARPSANTREP